MSECRKIEDSLWRYETLSRADRERIDAHLSSCLNCRAAFETIRALGLSANKDKKRLSSIDADSFDATVMQRIQGAKRTITHPALAAPRYTVRMAFSFALAAMVVLVLVKSVSDLHDSGISLPPGVRQQPETDTFGVINVELKPADEPFKADQTPKAGGETGQAENDIPKLAESPIITALPKSEPEKSSPQAVRQDVIKPAETPTLAIAPEMASKEALEKRVSAKEPEMAAMADRAEAEMAPEGDVFTILTAPVSSPAPDSISIDAIYVSDESISLAQQSRAAVLAEVYTDTGAIQAFMPQSSVLVTVEKMPKPIKMGIPVYPVWAKNHGISGTVWIKARIDIAGRVGETEVISCDRPGAGFEEAALAAARESRFVPASSNSINLPVWIVYPVKFIYKN